MSDLVDLISNGEGQHLDFKFRIDDQKKIARTLAAYANSGGGTLLIGVKDNGKIAGIYPEEEFHMIEGAASLYCFPAIDFTSTVLQEGRHLVLKIDVEHSENRHKAIDEDGNKAYYYRLEDHTVRGNKILDRIWVIEKQGLPQPAQFSEDELSILRVLREEEELSISKIYRKLDISKNKIDRFIAALVVWDIVGINVTNAGIRYHIVE